MDHQHRSPFARLMFRWLAIISTSLGTIGLILPLVPTTPFLLLALWAANRSSPALSDKIRSNRHFAPVLEAWENGRAIPIRAKILGIGLMCLSWTKLWWFGAPGHWLAVMAGIFLIGIVFLLSRPTPESVQQS